MCDFQKVWSYINIDFYGELGRSKYFQKKLGCQAKKDILYNNSVTKETLDDLLEDLILLLME